MSTENKTAMELIQQELAAIRTKAADDTKDVVRKEELDRHADAISLQIKSFQDALASANTISHVDVDAEEDNRAKHDVGLFFTEGRDAIGSVRADGIRFKDDTQVSAITQAAQGGFQLPKTFNDDVDGINRKHSQLRQVAKVVQGGLGFVTNIKTSKGTAGQRGEFDPLFYSAAPTYDQLNHTFQEINSTEAITVWADVNPTSRIDFANSVIQDVTEAMAEQESAFFMNGVVQQSKASGGTIKNGLLQQTKLVAGVDQFTNVVGSLAGVQTVAKAGAKLTVTPDDIINLLFSLHGRYDANTTVMTSREVVKAILTTKDSNNRYLLDVSGVPGSPAVSVMTKPLTMSDFFPLLASAGNTPIVVAGDFRQGVTIVDASNVRWLIDPYTDKRMLQYTGRRMTSSAIVNYNALRALYVQPAS